MRRYGFTLAELLISLAILGVIATFTIPKVLNSSQDEKWNSAAKEAAAMFVGAYHTYQISNTVDANTTVADLTQFMNYVGYDTSSVIDTAWTNATTTCSPSRPCLKLHNEGVFYYDSNHHFDAETSTNTLWGEYYVGGSAEGDRDRSIRFFLTFNGRLTTNGAIETPLCNNVQCYVGTPANDPPWFSWD